MSIVDLIADRVQRGMLFPLYPKAPGTSSKRVMLIAEGLWNFLQEEGPTDEMEGRKGFLLADLEVFVTGSPIGPKYLFLLYPAMEAVWEIRSASPDPSIRVLGRFLAKDVFVATNFALREDLGGWQSRKWRDVKLAARTRWTWLFQQEKPLITTDVKTVVSGAIDGQYFKGV